MAAFDPSGQNKVDVQEVLRGLRVNLNQRRHALIMAAYATCAGDVTRYDPTNLETVLNGEVSASQASHDFASTWDQSALQEVSKEDFLEYFKDISSAIEDEDYFELLMRSNWGIQDDITLTNDGLACDCDRVICTHVDGRETEEFVAKDLGISLFDEKALRAALRRQGISATKVRQV